jgi:hypothetical protein
VAAALLVAAGFPALGHGIGTSGAAAAGGAHGAVSAGTVQGIRAPTAVPTTRVASRLPATEPVQSSKNPVKNTASKGDGKTTLPHIFPAGGSCSSSVHPRACVDLYQLRGRALQLRKADGGRLTAEHDAEIQSEIDRILGQKSS